jgi:uncharacterized protein YukE
MTGGDAGVRSIPELQLFGKTLNQASASLEVLFQQLNRQMHQACDTWTDNNARVFMNQFEVSKQQIDKIAQEMQNFSAYIAHQCEVLEQYQNYKMRG